MPANLTVVFFFLFSFILSYHVLPSKDKCYNLHFIDEEDNVSFQYQAVKRSVRKKIYNFQLFIQ